MKRSLLAVCALAFLGFAAGAQELGFGSGGAAGILFQGGDATVLSQRIMGSTRYKLTPGDLYQLSITMQGTTSTFSLTLQENYDLQVPNIGTINVKGMYFAELRSSVVEKVRSILRYAEFVSLTLQSPARFDVTVFGGVQTPGTVTVNATQRVSDALILAGRFVAGATYRSIQLVRAGAVVPVDLQRYRLDGASERNPFLEPGDRILVPAAGTIVALSGQVRYPGTFEMLPGETLATVLGFAGGLLPDAKGTEIEVARISADGAVTRRTVSLPADGGLELANGDRVRVASRVENTQMILVTGAVFGAPVATDKPVTVPVAPLAVNVPWAPGITLLQVLELLGGPTPYANARNATVVHHDTGRVEVVNVEALWATRDAARDVELGPGDVVSVPLVSQVVVAGEVNAPGKLPWDAGLRVGDYILASGGINPLSGDPAGIWLIDAYGQRTRAGLDSSVTPGVIVYVEKNAWTQTQIVLSRIGVVTGFIGGILALLTSIVNFSTLVR